MEPSIPAFGDLEIYHAVLEHLQIGIYLVDCGQPIESRNDGAENITGQLRPGEVGLLGRDFIPRQKEADKDGVCELGGAPEELGKKVAASLVGTFLGLLWCDGLVGRLAANMSKAVDQHAPCHILPVTILAFMKGTAPGTAGEFGRCAIWRKSDTGGARA
jgi:hypothetical protein